LWLAQGPLASLLPTAATQAILDQPQLPAEFESVVQTNVTEVSAVHRIPLTATPNDDWWFYDSSQPTLSNGRLSLPGTDDFQSAIVRRALLGDNKGALMVLSFSGSTANPSWCEIGVSDESDQITAYLLLCEDTFRAVAGEFGANELENTVPLTADPASDLQRTLDVEYGLLIARGLRNRLRFVIWKLDNPAEQAVFSIEGYPYAPNYFFAKPYPGMELTIRDFVEIEFETLK
jgi:hypothetical protein